MLDGAEIKGMTYLSYVEPLKQAQPRLWEAIERRLPADSRALFAQPLFAHHWYPRSHLHALLREVDELGPAAGCDLRELGRLAARYQLNVVYRMFLKFASPAMVFGRAASVWSRQSSAGRFTVVESAEHHLVGELEDPQLPEGVPELIAGWSDAIIELLGRTPRPTRFALVAPGRWRFHVQWTPR